MITLLESAIDKALSSSKTVMNLIKEMTTLAKEIKELKESVVSIIHAVKFHQAVIDELANEKPAKFKFDVDLIGKKNDKKEKPN